METASLEQILKSNPYPGRGIVIGLSPDSAYAVTAYFIMGRSVNSRNRIFVQDGAEGGNFPISCPVGRNKHIFHLKF